MENYFNVTKKIYGKGIHFEMYRCMLAQMKYSLTQRLYQQIPSANYQIFVPVFICKIYLHINHGSRNIYLGPRK